MASRAPAFTGTPLDVLLASVPSLPRAILSRLTARMIDRLDELDGDTDLEPTENGAWPVKTVRATCLPDQPDHLGRFAMAACGLTSCLTNHPVSGEIQPITVIAF